MFFLIPLILIFGATFGIGYIVWPKFREIKKEDPTAIPQRAASGSDKAKISAKLESLQESSTILEIKENFWDLMFPELTHFLNSARSKFKVFKDNAAVDYEKFLRRVRILSLKTDNFVNKLLEKRQKNGVKSEFKEVKNDSSNRIINASFKIKENNLIAEIARNPKDKNLYKALAVFYTENQMHDDAEEVYNVVLELDQNDSEAKKYLEEIPKIV